ncbi:gelsolin-like, partial [Mizuhopecten yessoensis]|uniref:gelsolin-like n=1 Tax=Mizuhopecten yessoensis TaxID=6573 RepID=UPI000B45EA1D
IDTSSDKIDFKDLQRRRSGTVEVYPTTSSPPRDEVIKKWQVEITKTIPMESEEVGIFSSSCCYVILYSYRDNVRQHHMVYFWQGLRSSLDVKGASAIMAQRIDDQEAAGGALQIRVLEGKEPPMFLHMLTGRMVVFMYKYNTWGDITQRKRLFQIRGSSREKIRTIEVEPSSSSLNSQDTFLLMNDQKTVIWKGQLSNSCEQSLSRDMAGYLAPENIIECISEGEETDDFWEALGGICEYAKCHNNPGTEWFPPRLMQCSNATGRFRVEEILEFTQQDLCEGDVMLLDTHQEVRGSCCCI